VREFCDVLKVKKRRYETSKSRESISPLSSLTTQKIRILKFSDIQTSDLKPRKQKQVVTFIMKCSVWLTTLHVSFDCFVLLFTESTSGPHSFSSFRLQRPVVNTCRSLCNKNDIASHLQLQTYFTQMITRKSNNTRTLHGVNSQNTAII
jgi:hypothetical protein